MKLTHSDLGIITCGSDPYETLLEIEGAIAHLGVFIFSKTPKLVLAVDGAAVVGHEREVGPVAAAAYLLRCVSCGGRRTKGPKGGVAPAPKGVIVPDTTGQYRTGCEEVPSVAA